ncbi:MAG: divalent-cation tolerance protein CutA [Candidatus Sulfomarinibacteraceae bacterium]|jgi:periplasmic divalent cation tolerance protein|nr:divalent-cation tolerance protein CutA [Chondromyces sp.]
MPDLEKITLIMTSVGTEQQAVEISEELIARRLATCINIVPCLRSIYRWKGKVCEDTEYLLLIKTPERLFEVVSAAIREFHSYELPEILALPVTAAESNFHQWVLQMVEPGEEPSDDESSDYD